MRTLPGAPLALLAFCAIAAPTVQAQVPAAQPLPNLSGTWVCNQRRSDFDGELPPSPCMYRVEYRDPFFEIARLNSKGQKVKGRALRYVVGASGETTIASTPFQFKAFFEKGALFVDRKGSYGPHRMHVIESYSLSDDGLVLTIRRRFNSFSRLVDQTVVLDRRPESTINR